MVFGGPGEELAVVALWIKVPLASPYLAIQRIIPVKKWKSNAVFRFNSLFKVFYI